MTKDQTNDIGSAASRYVQEKQFELVRELIDGLSGALVWLVRSSGNRHMVLKVQSASTEYDFYRSVLPRIDQAQSWTPVIFDAHVEPPYNFILMEYIAKPWDSKHWNKDPRALRILAELHADMNPPTLEDKSLWSRQDITQYCESHLPQSTINQILRIYDVYTSRCEINRATCSGDPNPRNWLVRDDGSLVLVDWQNGTVANPALDLAGWVSTYLPMEEVEAVATSYSQFTNLPPQEVFEDTLVFMTRRWSMNFKMASNAANPSAWDDAVNRLSTDLPSWVEQVVRQLEI